MKRAVILLILFVIPMVSCKSLNDAAKEGDASGVRKLISQGGDINAKDKEGKTALMYAAENGRAVIVRMLIDANADVNAGDKDGKTALMYAAGSDNMDSVKYLIAAEADVEAEDNSGDIALYKTKSKSEVRNELLKYSVKYRSQFLCKINTLFKYLEKYPQITVSYIGKSDSGIGAVYYGDGVILRHHKGILPEMMAVIKTYGVVFTEDLYEGLGKCGK